MSSPKPTLIAPSILAADFMNLSNEIRRIEAAQADVIHCDVMDGHFVPNLTFGPPLIRQLKNITKLPLDVHLMILNPEKWVRAYAEAGADWLTVHFEATIQCEEVLREIIKFGVKPGLSIKPNTPAEKIEHLVRFCHHILIMTVEPGFGGQKFRNDCLGKVQFLKQVIEKNGYDTVLEVDGGINRQTIYDAHKAGATVFVAGTEIFAAEDYTKRIYELRAAAQLD